MDHPAITSLQNPRVKEAAKLRDHRQRKQQGCFLIDGARELDRAISAGIELCEFFVCEELCESPASRQVLERLRHEASTLTGRPEIWPVTPQVFAKLAFGDRAEGVAGVARATELKLTDLVLGENPLIAVLEAAEKPGNIGAVLRSADAAGLDAVVIADGGTDLYNPNTIRASLGTIFSMQVATSSSAEAIAWLRARGLSIYAARLDAATEYGSVDFRRSAAIVLGSEAAGLSPTWSADDVTSIRLPMRGIADSLNVSATAAVLFYEALRQRTVAAGG
jgi:TrmH family RNA methyltransferase